MPEETQKQYELVCILSPKLEESDLENIKKEIEQIINTSGGTVNFKEAKKHDLAYPINKQGQGIYLASQVSVPPEKVASVSKELKLNKQVLRHLITQFPVIKPEAEKPKPKRTIKKPIVATAVTNEQIEAEKEKKPSVAKAPRDKTELEEIDKKLDEIIGEI